MNRMRSQSLEETRKCQHRQRLTIWRGRRRWKKCDVGDIWALSGRKIKKKNCFGSGIVNCEPLVTAEIDLQKPVHRPTTKQSAVHSGVGYWFTGARAKTRDGCIGFTGGDGSINSWDSTLKSTDIKYIHEDIFTNKNKNKVNRKQNTISSNGSSREAKHKYQSMDNSTESGGEGGGEMTIP